MNPKVIGGAIGGWITVILFWVLSAFGGIEVPAAPAAAITSLVGTGVAWMVSETGADIPVVGIEGEERTENGEK